MRDEAQERLELLSAIQDLGYESLRYSIFNEYGPGEWEVVIDFDDSMQVYNVYALSLIHISEPTRQVR